MATNSRLEAPPKERLLRSGAATLSDAELVGLLLPGVDRTATELAETLLLQCGGLAGLLRAGDPELRLPGIGRSKRAAVLAAAELSRRFAKARMPRRNLLTHPAAVAAYLSLRYAHQDQEIMGALYVDCRKRLLEEAEIYRGTLSGAAVEPREILRRGLRLSASAFILFHTHPTGDPVPSREDLVFTCRMLAAGDLLGLELLDHLVLGGGGRFISVQRWLKAAGKTLADYVS